jgi:hypothetical protein
LISIKQPIDNVDKFHGQKIGIPKQGINRTRGGRIRHVGYCPPSLVLWAGGDVVWKDRLGKIRSRKPQRFECIVDALARFTPWWIEKPCDDAVKS